MPTKAAAADGTDSSRDQRPKPSDADWLARLSDASTREEAAQAIFHKYSEQLLRLIHSRLAESLKKRAEPVDIMQSVFKSLFSRKFELQDTDSLFPLLTEMCIRKSADAARRHTATCRDVRAEQSHDENLHGQAIRPSNLRDRNRSFDSHNSAADVAGDTGINDTEVNNTGCEEMCSTIQKSADDSSIDQATLQLMARGATAEQACIAVEIFHQLPSELQTIMMLRLEGYHDDEIAAQLNCTRRTIVRRVALLRLHMEKFIAK